MSYFSLISSNIGWNISISFYPFPLFLLF
uniref:Uncharacterized protein n=1 Tax=Heterorhabditis bacteriophora TaxID=37862 RepID=A0A1I7WUK9_HETBA